MKKAVFRVSEEGVNFNNLAHFYSSLGYFYSLDEANDFAKIELERAKSSRKEVTIYVDGYSVDVKNKNTSAEKAFNSWLNNLKEPFIPDPDYTVVYN